MLFSPAIPAGGVAGLKFLDRTFDAQFAAFSGSPVLEREISYFLDRAGEVSSAADLVADRRLLAVALGAFGLEGEIDKRAFVRRVLEEGTHDPSSLANRLADPAWADLSAALGFGDAGGVFGIESKRREIAERYRLRQFESAVGEQDVDLRLALTFRREIGRIVGEAGSDAAAWFRILGSRPLRTVIEGAFNLPSSFGQLDIDAQRSRLSERTERVFGNPSPSVFADPANVERAISRYLVNVSATAGPAPGMPGATALTILQSSGIGAGAAASLFRSNL